jgi:hypothetical protein
MGLAATAVAVVLVPVVLIAPASDVGATLEISINNELHESSVELKQLDDQG